MLDIGSILQERYAIEAILGKGGYGAVYRAFDKRLSKTVALKESLHADPSALRQFELEARLLANLRHPSLPTVTDYFGYDNCYYLVMEYISGETLSEYIDRQPDGKLNEREALRIVGGIMDALKFLHSQTPPIIHRDIKPDNIRIALNERRSYLVDFGLAKLYRPHAKTTRAAQAVTPGFSPIEQYGGITDERSDIYALGATLYSILSGTTLAPAPQRVVADPVKPLRTLNRNVSPELEIIVMRMLSVQVEGRYQTVDDVRNELNFIQRMPVRRMAIIGGSIALAVLSLIVVIILMRPMF